MFFVEFTDVDVDGCGTDINTIAMIESERNEGCLTNGTIERVNQAIADYKKSVDGMYDTDGCITAAQEQLEKEGYKVAWIVPSTTICF